MDSMRCQVCDKTFTRPEHLQNHLRTAAHSRKRALANADEPQPKRRLVQPASAPEFSIRMIKRGMGDLFKIYRAQFRRVLNDIYAITALLIHHMVYLLDRAVSDTNGIKAQLRCKVQFYKATDEKVEMTAHFMSRQHIYLHTTNKEQEYAAAMTEMTKKIEEFVRNGSGWIVKKIDFVDLYISKYTPIRGTTHVKLPKSLASKKAIINIKNKDEKCFMWSVLAALHPAQEHAERVSHYKAYQNELDFTGIPLPVDPNDVERFERQNGLSINVFGFGKDLYPLYTTKDKSQEPINLLLLTPEGKPAHYCLIKDLNKLLFQSTKHANRKYICPYCLCPFNTEKRLETHQEYCTLDRQRIEMPEDPILKFRNFHHQIRAPYVMYADFECFVEPTGEEPRTHHHIPNSYCLLGVRQCCNEPDYDEPSLYRGLNPVRKFLEDAIRKGERFISKPPITIKMNDLDMENFYSTTDCHICGERLDDDRVRDHCHQCGRFRGAAHSVCNIKLYEKRDVTVFFHNLRRYDGHLLMQEAGAIAREKNIQIDCVPKGPEDYISFNFRLKSDGKYWRLRFVDTLSFLNASLETLASNLPPEQFHSLNKFTSHPTLLQRKGVYLYEFVDKAEKFDLPTLPDRDAFFNALKKEHITQDEYTHAQNVWNTFNCTDFGQYHDLYLLTDVLLLTDVFQEFRNFDMEHYKLDPAHYITLPSLSWDSLLKKTGVRLHLLTDPDMYQFFTAGIRGGVSYINHRHAKAHHHLIGPYNPYDPVDNMFSEFITYLDANNLYGWAMKQPLPVGDFEWVEEQDQLPIDEPRVGYVWEVDLEYPPEIHDLHNDYPMAPERMEIRKISPYSERLKKKLNIPDVQTEKLVPNLHDKHHYIVHHDCLKLYLKHGLKLKKIHRGIRFREEAWMAPYIDFNTNMRKNAKNKFQKDLFKLKNNAVFGKSMENIFKYVDIRLVWDEKKYEKLVANPLYKETQLFKHDLAAVSMSKEKAVLNRPIFTGFAILDNSKTLMYRFHYEYILPKYGQNAKLLFTDTDSLCYSILTDDIYLDMLQDRDDWFDTSDYPTDHYLHSDKNKKVIGMMKDEMNGVPIREFVGLRSKMYSIDTATKAHMRAKGVVGAVVKKEISHEDYRRTLMDESSMRHTMLGFRNKDHEVYTVSTDKTSLSAYDDKRFILQDGITTLAYGHYRIKEEALDKHPIQ